jgi:hypothetical protein
VWRSAERAWGQVGRGEEPKGARRVGVWKAYGGSREGVGRQGERRGTGRAEGGAKDGLGGRGGQRGSEGVGGQGGRREEPRKRVGWGYGRRREGSGRA